MSKIDLYNLKASSAFPLSGTEEITENLALTLSTASSAGIVTGTITAGGVPLEGATVKIFDVNNVPIYHGITNPQGKYTISEVTAGSYSITATKQGYLTPVVLPITVNANRPTTVDIDLTADADATKNTLFGKILQSVVLTPIENAIVNVYQVAGTVRTLVMTTLTNSAGQYFAPILSTGDFVVIANKFGYLQSESSVVTLATSKIEPLDLTMILNQATNTGTVSGIITDETTGLPIQNSIVALYNVSGSVETIVQLTKTNAGGRYLFGNVSAGDHIVKAFAQTNAVEP